MDLSNIKLGNKIIIYDKNNKYTAFVEHIMEDNLILFQAILGYNEEINLKIGSIYNFLFFTDTFELNCKCEIINYLNEGRRMFYLAKAYETTDKSKELQKRKNVRIYCNLPYSIKILQNENEIGCIIKDISFGGTRILTNFKLELENKLEIKLTKNKEFFLAKGNIIQYQNYPKSNYKNQYRIRFFEVDFSDKDFLRKYFNV